MTTAMNIPEAQKQRQLERKAAKAANRKKRNPEWQLDPRVAAIHMLRVNVKSLAAEARIIRQEEQRCGFNYYQQLHLHRVNQLRKESRIAQLALAFLRGRTYAQVEGCAKPPKDLAYSIANKICRKGVQVTMDHILAWMGV